MRALAAAPRSLAFPRIAGLVLTLVLCMAAFPVAAGARPASAPTAVPGRILVKFAPGASAAVKAAASSAAGAVKIRSIPQLGVDVLKVPATASATALARLQHNPNVAYAELDRVVTPETTEITPNDLHWSSQWSQRLTNTSKAWSITTGSPAVTVAILDTGLTQSPELSGRVLPGRNIITGSSDVTDTYGHGTRAASVACANSNNAAGIASYSWNCRVLPVKVMESSGTMSDLAAGITWATDNGAQVINMSLSGATGTTTLQSAVKYASSRNVLLVAAAGNQGGTTVRYPAAYPEVIAVAGTDWNDARYSWSNYGAWVDMAAPGQNMSVSTAGTFGGFSGTSSASPALAGVAALALSLPSQPTAATVRSALQQTAAPVGDIVQHGRVDALATLVALADGAAPAPTPTPSPTPEPAPTATAAPEPTPSPSAEPTPTHPAPEPTPPPAQLDLSVTTAKVKGVNTATLSWSSAVGSPAEVRRDGRVVATGLGGTTYTDSTGTKGGLTLIYQVCGTDGCTARVSGDW